MNMKSSARYGLLACCSDTQPDTWRSHLGLLNGLSQAGRSSWECMPFVTYSMLHHSCWDQLDGIAGL